MRQRTARWVYNHQEEQERYLGQMYYLNQTVTDRAFATDLRIFGLKPWMDEVWERVMRLFRDYLKRLEMHRLWNDAADLVLTFARDGIAYAYLIALALREGMPAARPISFSSPMHLP